MGKNGENRKENPVHMRKRGGLAGGCDRKGRAKVRPGKGGDGSKKDRRYPAVLFVEKGKIRRNRRS